MQSGGGLATFAEAEKRAAAAVMSGPVGGVVASQYLASRGEHRNIVTTDMGGTSFDVGLVLDERFIDPYEGRFGKGSAFPEGGVEITTFRVVAANPVPRAELDTVRRPENAGAVAEPGTRRVFSGCGIR